MDLEVEFHPMTDVPDREQSVDNFSKTVIIYELDNTTKQMYDVALGYYSFNTKSWYIVGGEPLVAYCWTYLPELPDMRRTYFKTVNIE